MESDTESKNKKSPDSDEKEDRENVQIMSAAGKTDFRDSMSEENTPIPKQSFSQVSGLGISPSTAVGEKQVHQQTESQQTTSILDLVMQPNQQSDSLAAASDDSSASSIVVTKPGQSCISQVTVSEEVGQAKTSETETHYEGQNDCSIKPNTESNIQIPSPVEEQNEDQEQIDTISASSQKDLNDRIPNFLSTEETNFLRFCHLVQKISPEAVRCRFDQEFPPPNLDSIINANQAKLEKLKKKKVIMMKQWKQLHPIGSPAVSSDFDLTLMICLFRHLLPVVPQSRQYDQLPPAGDESFHADLARVKYHRNRISHSSETSIENSDFAREWEEISKAVGRIGGDKYKQQCATLLKTNLDASYRDIYKEFLQTKDDLKEKKEDYEKISKNPVPNKERDIMNEIMQTWKSKDNLFVVTSGYKALRKCLKTDTAVIVSGRPGCGKSCTAQHALFSLCNDGYDVIPVTSISDMIMN